MKSHACEFDAKELLRLVLPPLLPVAVFAAAMHLGARAGLLPAPRPALDVDRTILVHQAEASRKKQDAEVLLIGDSSCLMDVTTPMLAERLRRPALNLGTLSYLGLEDYARLLREFAAANPGRPKAVVLLMHPEALRRVGPEPHQTRILRRFLAGEDDHFTPGAWGRASGALGLEVFRGRVWARLPAPLGTNYGPAYGFTRDLDRFLGKNGGSLFDPGRASFRGSAEYRLSPTLEPASRAFRAAVPPGVKLFVGITPAPERFAGPAHIRRHELMLRQWGLWLGADDLLIELPATMPEEHFASVAHLNAAGARAYTAKLAVALAQRR
jgi:hypothetical protein